MATDRLHRPQPMPAGRPGRAGWPRRGIALTLAAAGLAALAGTAAAAASAFEPTSVASCNQFRERLRLPLALNDALQLAACRSPELARAVAGVALGQAGLDQARAANSPVLSLDASLSMARNSGGLGSGGEVVSDGANSVGLGLTARWVLFDFGQRAADRQRAGHALGAAQAEQDAAALAAASQVLRAYSETTVTEARAALRGQAHQVARRNLEVVLRLKAAGVNAQPDLLRAQAVVAEQQLAFLRARGQARAARAGLATLLGLADLAPSALPGVSQILPGLAEPLDINAWVAQALAVHPLLRAADARHRAAQASTDALRAEGRGNVSVSASMGNSRVSELGSAGASNNRTQRAGIYLSLPLWDGGVQSAQVQQSAARERIARAETDLAHLQIETNVRREAQAWLAAREMIGAAETALAAARQAEDAARVRFAARVGSLGELLLAQRSVVDAELARLDSLAEWTEVQWRLLAAMGRFS